MNNTLNFVRLLDCVANEQKGLAVLGFISSQSSVANEQKSLAVLGFISSQSSAPHQCAGGVFIFSVSFYVLSLLQVLRPRGKKLGLGMY